MDISKINDNLFKTQLGNSVNDKNKSEFENHLNNALKSNDKEQLKKVCNDFEGIMMNILYKQMKSTVMKSDLIPASAGKEMFEDMLDQELVKTSAESGTFGLGNMLYKSLEKNIKSE